MLHNPRSKKTVLKIAVTLDAGNGEQFAYMFVPPTLRISDVLNDERDFLPFERADGSIIMIQKKFIRCLVPMDSSKSSETSDPYGMLGVQPSASDLEVQDAYRRAIGAVHPDRVRSLGLPAEFMDLANRRAACLNEAYSKIKNRRSAERQPA